MSTLLHAIRWRQDSDGSLLLVAGNKWLLDGLRRVLPRAQSQPVEHVHYDTLVAERGALHLISDAQIEAIDAFLLVDPEDRERWRVVAIKAGDPKTHISVIPSIAAFGAAEHAMMLILSLTRQLLPDYSATVDGSWTRTPVGPNLFGKTLGIVGLGRSGQALATRASSFGMHVVFHDIDAKDEAQARLPVVPRRLDQILREADVVSLHLPATPDTIRLIDAPELAAMKSTSVLINVADGRLIDEGSLIKALRAGDIAGAGLDTFAYEPLAEDSPLIGFENVVLTPRTAWMNHDEERSQWLRQIQQHLAHDI